MDKHQGMQMAMDLRSYADEIDKMFKPDPDPPQLLTPKGIKFWVGTTGKIHGLLFNDGKQMLGYCDDGEVFEVESTVGFESTRIVEALPLTPCKYEDIAFGEFFSVCGNPRHIDIKLNLPRSRTSNRVALIRGKSVSPYDYAGLVPVWKIGKC